MKVLRDKKILTRFLILYYSAVSKPTRLSEIADELEMTEQGVSNYISDMSEEGLIDKSSKKYHPTSEGMELVRNVLSELGEFLDEASNNVEFISSCTAIADVSIEEGEEVGLFMKDGFLHASREGSSSMGTALDGAEPGEPLKVGGLQGITEMDVGKLTLLVVETEDKDGLDEISSYIEEISYDLLSVMSESQYGITNMLDIEPDIKFAPWESTVKALEKGQDVLLLLSEDDLEGVLEKLKNRNRGYDEKYRVDHEIIKL